MPTGRGDDDADAASWRPVLDAVPLRTDKAGSRPEHQDSVGRPAMSRVGLDPGPVAVTALSLSIWIVATLLLQLGVGVGIAMSRRGGAVQPGSAGERAAADEVGAAAGSPGGGAAWTGWREFRVARRAFEDARQTQCSFYLEPVDGQPLAPCKAGQYLTFELPPGAVDVEPGGVAGPARRLIRCYSLSDRPQPQAFRITVKRALPPADRPTLPPGLASGYLHDRVQAGDVLRVKAPAGNFYIDDDTSLPAVFIAGGIGITPMMAMVSECLAHQPGRELHLYYGLRDGGEHAFKAVLEAAAAAHPALHLNVVYGQPRADDEPGRDFQHTGFIDIALLRRTLPAGRHRFHVCGPPPMMAALLPALAAWGVPAADLHFEAFGPASAPPVGLGTAPPVAADVAGAFDIRFQRAARTLVWDGRDDNLLDFAERHGVAVESGCRAGSCGACETRLVSGQVTYAHAPDHAVAPGRCLLCVGRPAGALVLEA